MKDESDSLRPGDPAPPFSLASADGARMALDDFRGRPVALCFFRGTW
jgi:peroxiredoxin